MAYCCKAIVGHRLVKIIYFFQNFAQEVDFQQLIKILQFKTVLIRANFELWSLKPMLKNPNFVRRPTAAEYIMYEWLINYTMRLTHYQNNKLKSLIVDYKWIICLALTLHNGWCEWAPSPEAYIVATNDADEGQVGLRELIPGSVKQLRNKNRRSDVVETTSRWEDMQMCTRDYAWSRSKDRKWKESNL